MSNSPRYQNFKSPVLILLLLSLFLLTSCGGKQQSITKQQATIDLALLETLPSEDISYNTQVQPVLERRCVVCHGCYDAPCQLKLSSPAGVGRGANIESVYNGARFKTMSPTRLYIDAKSTEEWREKGFHSVINESDDVPEINLEQSVMYQMLRLKQMNPQARVGMLPDSVDLSLARSESCPTVETFDKYARKFPKQGMPFAMPNLNDEEYRILVQWLAQGSPVPEAKKPSADALMQIERWETFLNGADNKQRLVSRYLYEHLFIGHMHFKGSDDREFYRLVRSSTPSGQVVDEIPTVRPYDNPGEVFYYRLQRFPGDIVAKTHTVYELSDARLARYKALFIEPEYNVTVLPSWEPLVAANPFKAFRDIPVRSRYEFLLDDARYFIEGFIKGPVCRGMIALNVIEDRFWVTFLDPEKDSMLVQPEFLEEMSDYLQIPSVQAGNISLLSTWKDYSKREQVYAAGRFKYYEAMDQHDIEEALEFLWDGNGDNPNAALTIFRHFDSASVDYGFVGDYPETAWIIDYPLFERIHYLLVAGFNVFGNLKHQLNTRLYMDFLRMEGEDMYLSMLPTTHRKAIRDGWYAGMREGMNDVSLEITNSWMTKDVVTGYKSDDPQRELFQHMEKKFAAVIKKDDVLNRCEQPPCHAKDANDDKRRADAALGHISTAKGLTLAAFPDVAFIRVLRGGAAEDDLAYTVIRNKAYKNVTSLFQDEKDSDVRDYSKDSLTVVDWLEGSYPNFFFVVDIDDVEKFSRRYSSLASREDYERFVSIYGVRRTNQQFWEIADWFQDEYLREKPVYAGLFDLNRYQNR
ncbi:MAG: isomerase [Proteobacteria bacterium]|nr:isomerase [Pseudomonadota bacterium]